MHGSARRWPRRVAIAGIGLVGAVLLVGIGIFVYARVRYGEIPKASVTGLTPTVPGQPFDILLVGSDSRSSVSAAAGAFAFGSAAQSDPRGEMIVVARVAPATHQVRLLAIPRATWVEVPGTVSGVSGPNHVYASLDSGPSLLVQTIRDSLHIPVSYYIGVDVPAFSAMVNAFGGIYLDFRYPVRDAYSGLDVTTTGCQLVSGAQALALVRSRRLYYFAKGKWNYDSLSDFSRIERQDAFFRAMVARLRSAEMHPLALNSFVGTATSSVTIDRTLSESEIFALARMLRGFSSSELVAETLPTTPVSVGGKRAFALEIAPDEAMIATFLAFGQAAGAHAAPLGSSVTVTTVPGARPTSLGAIATNARTAPWNPVPCSP